MKLEELRHELKKRFKNNFGRRFAGAFIYGSEARGEASEDSDIDVMVLLRGPINLWEDIEKGIDATYDLTLQLDRPIHPEPVNIEDFKKGEYSIYRNVQKEGIMI